MNSITYNRKRREYILHGIGGRPIATFDEGDDAAGLMAARQTAVQQADPDIYALARRMQLNYRHRPELRELIWTAAEIIIQGRVSPITQEDDYLPLLATRIYADAKKIHFYPVSFGEKERGNLTCICPEFTLATAQSINGHRLCEHILAYRMDYENSPARRARKLARQNREEMARINAATREGIEAVSLHPTDNPEITASFKKFADFQSRFGAAAMARDSRIKRGTADAQDYALAEKYAAEGSAQALNKFKAVS